MRFYQLHVEQRLAANLDTAWAFLSDPHNLATITPPQMNFRITSPTGHETHAGQIVTYTVTPLLGIRMRWVTEITHCDPPHYFVDEQRMGPYRFWHHQHRLTSVDGGVAMRDTISYALKLDLPGVPFVHNWIVRPQLERIFAHRRDVLAERFGELAPPDA